MRSPSAVRLGGDLGLEPELAVGRLTAALAAHAFSRMRFAGRQVLMLAVLTVLMLPSIATLAALFVLLNKVTFTLGGATFNLRNSLWGVGLAVLSGLPARQELTAVGGEHALGGLAFLKRHRPLGAGPERLDGSAEQDEQARPHGVASARGEGGSGADGRGGGEARQLRPAVKTLTRSRCSSSRRMKLTTEPRLAF